MLDTELLEEGLYLMVFGMGFVFVFLTVLVIATTAMSKTVGRLVPEPAKDEDDDTLRRPPTPTQGGDELMAVISTAVHRYRQRHRR
ncbi:OadG family protein [Litchfieldella rifensis]|uniref:Probable oxaloacetate decarboxylase gamma chain n=1 Tax=Litchfieldella rifensis TaxID=762643 RepID=A0ABV7LQH9_9GAMM